jgi:hypothetical protein
MKDYLFIISIFDLDLFFKGKLNLNLFLYYCWDINKYIYI